MTSDDLLTVVNNMVIAGVITLSQTHGVVVYVPKTQGPIKICDYRPLTLMNSDIKLLTRILANRLRPWLNDILHPSQHCGVRDNILGAVAATREAVAELTNAHVCLLSLDFTEAFDRISHTYLYKVLEHCGLSEWMNGRIRQLYETATSSAQINGYISGPVPIISSIRQGCPLSMLLFALCLDPLLRRIDEGLTRCRPKRRESHLAVIAYADDITIILRSLQEVQVIQEAIRTYEAAAGAVLNIQKSKAMALRTWNTATPVMGIDYHNELRILGIYFATTIRASARASWAHVTRNIRTQAQEA
jgi:hypothetical protein